MKKRTSPRTSSIFKNKIGSVSVETALILSILGAWIIGVVDFGLAFARKSELANAARAGMQYAIVRRPVGGDYSAIIDAVLAAAPQSGPDGVFHDPVVTMYCTCSDGAVVTPSACVSSGDNNIDCADGSLRAAYLQIDVSETYTLMFPYPGLGQELEISHSVVARLN